MGTTDSKEKKDDPGAEWTTAEEAEEGRRRPNAGSAATDDDVVDPPRFGLESPAPEHAPLLKRSLTCTFLHLVADVYKPSPTPPRTAPHHHANPHQTLSLGPKPTVVSRSQSQSAGAAIAK